ncbi:MAG: DUF2891 domain-containing protein [bacterium]|nr:DUF2891 domain-containing protein [bacterium]
MKNGAWLLLILTLISCDYQKEEQKNELKRNQLTQQAVVLLKLTQEQAEELVQLPLTCINQEYPNKLNQVIAGNHDLRSPESLHPAFYGCFDWHSSVHGHWSLVRLLRTFPNIKQRDAMIAGLQDHITPENIAGELAYFDHPHSQGFERMYGWAWLLKLSEELHRWDDPTARELEQNLQPLTDLIVEKVETFLPKLNYPIRVGTHTNTAFALCMVYDYANAVGNNELLELVSKRAREYYQSDRDCPLSWEPSGYDFLSPCLEEADLMRRVLDKDEFRSWLTTFLPKLVTPSFELDPGIVTDREDGHLVHLDGLNFSRAWCLKGLTTDYPEYSYLNAIANEHINHSLPDLTDGNYEGGHWLVSFALMALTE